MGLQQELQEFPGIAGLVTVRQAIQAPLAILAFAQGQLESLQLQAADPHLARQQAAEQVRRQPHPRQAQTLFAVADLNVARHHQRLEAAPGARQFGNPHRYAELLASFVLQLLAVFGHQRHQLPAKADVQRQQHQYQGAQTQDDP